MDLNRIKGKAQDLLKEHGDKIEKGVDRAEKFAKSKSGKHEDKVDKVADRLRGMIPRDDQPGTDASPPPPPATATPPPDTQPPATPPPADEPPTGQAPPATP